MTPLLQFVLAGAGTYMIRVSAVIVAGRLGAPSASVQATLSLIAPAVLAAIVADRLVLVDGTPVAQWDWWIAGLVAGWVAVRWKSAGLTMAAGIATVWVIAAIA